MEGARKKGKRRWNKIAHAWFYTTHWSKSHILMQVYGFFSFFLYIKMYIFFLRIASSFLVFFQLGAIRLGNAFVYKKKNPWFISYERAIMSINIISTESIRWSLWIFQWAFSLLLISRVRHWCWAFFKYFIFFCRSKSTCEAKEIKIRWTWWQ